MTLIKVTNAISLDEKCYYLAEVVATPMAMGVGTSQKDFRGRKRYRLVWVVRDGNLTLFKMLSPNPIGAPQIRIPGLMEHTVGELFDIADAHANKGSEWEGELAREKQAESTLHNDIAVQIERNNLMRASRSTFGPLVKVQRDGYPDVLKRKARPRN